MIITIPFVQEDASYPKSYGKYFGIVVFSHIVSAMEFPTFTIVFDFCICKR